MAKKGKAGSNAKPKATVVKAARVNDLKTTKVVEFKAIKITEQLVSECREKLLTTKGELLNRVKEARGKLDQFERGGDEADHS